VLAKVSGRQISARPTRTKADVPSSQDNWGVSTATICPVSKPNLLADRPWYKERKSTSRPRPNGISTPMIELRSRARPGLRRSRFPANAIALTVDDGPHPHWTPPILRLLDRYHIPALFCMISNQVLGHEDTARSVVRAGHQVANHSWSHPSAMARQPAHWARQEILRAQEKIYSATSYTPSLFRSPGGSSSPSLARTAADTRMLPLDWSDDPRDWTRPRVAHITRRLPAARPGQILLCHDGGGDRVADPRRAAHRYPGPAGARLPVRRPRQTVTAAHADTPWPAISTLMPGACRDRVVGGIDEAIRTGAAAGALNVTRHGLGTDRAEAVRELLGRVASRTGHDTEGGAVGSHRAPVITAANPSAGG
jgi:peptidoglycan/xylan/chitin deacetylase (PgdA/CDA1 family)